METEWDWIASRLNPFFWNSGCSARSSSSPVGINALHLGASAAGLVAAAKHWQSQDLNGPNCTWRLASAIMHLAYACKLVYLMYWGGVCGIWGSARLARRYMASSPTAFGANARLVAKCHAAIADTC